MATCANRIPRRDAADATAAGPQGEGHQMAEGVGFEPTEACTSHAFEACPFGRSGTLPGGTLPLALH